MMHIQFKIEIKMNERRRQEISGILYTYRKVPFSFSYPFLSFLSTMMYVYVGVNRRCIATQRKQQHLGLGAFIRDH